MKTYCFKNGRVIDPANNVDEVRDLVVREGRIDPEPVKPEEEVETIDVTGKIVAPGLIDLHVHLREPGQTAKETIASGSRAAAAGGFSTIVCMPNTSPVADGPSSVAWIRERAAQTAVVRVHPTGSITKNLEGQLLASIGSMCQAGIVAVTDDGHCVQNHELMRRAVEYARMFDLPVLDHCQDYNLVGDGVMNEGHWSTVLGLPGWPAIGEEIMVMRNILLAELCGHQIHCQHLTCKGSIRLIRAARSRGARITGEVCPHHIALTDSSIQTFDTRFKMNPPLRSEEDVEALIEGIADGTVSILASDHAPHCDYEKEVEFDQAPFGITGLETELGLFSTILVHERKVLDWPGLIEKYTVNPAQLLKLSAGTLAPGAAADITVIDPDLEWTYQAGQTYSRSQNTPFDGWELKGRAVQTWVDGSCVWSADHGGSWEASSR